MKKFQYRSRQAHLMKNKTVVSYCVISKNNNYAIAVSASECEFFMCCLS